MKAWLEQTYNDPPFVLFVTPLNTSSGQRPAVDLAPPPLCTGLQEFFLQPHIRKVTPLTPQQFNIVPCPCWTPSPLPSCSAPPHHLPPDNAASCTACRRIIRICPTLPRRRPPPTRHAWPCGVGGSTRRRTRRPSLALRAHSQVHDDVRHLRRRVRHRRLVAMHTERHILRVPQLRAAHVQMPRMPDDVGRAAAKG